VKQKQTPIKCAPLSPIQFSPDSHKGIQPKAIEPKTPAREKPTPSVSTDCGYPRKSNSSRSPTSRNTHPQNAANFTKRPPCRTTEPKSKTPAQCMHSMRMVSAPIPQTAPPQKSLPNPPCRGRP